jgi:short-subunit dehydrogenase
MRQRESWRGKTALVTGASSGIGAATARLLARAGMRLLLVARRADRLEAVSEEIRTAGGVAEPLAADLALAGERLRVFRWACHAGGIDVLVNNAGLGWYGYFSEMPWETALEMIQVNIAASAHLASLFLPGMKSRGRGHIVSVGSIAGGIPSQGVAMYSATKAFLDAFTTSLHRELRGTSVRASVIRPGPVATEFFDAAASRPAGGRVPTERLGIRPERVAQAILRVLKHPRRAVYVPWTLGVVPWVEATSGWLMDLLGPLHLRSRSSRT